MPTTSTFSSAAAAFTRAGHSSAVQPLRDNPVSILRCTLARRPTPAAASATRVSSPAELTETSMSCRTAGT